MNDLFFLHRMEGPVRVVMPFGCSKKMVKFDQIFAIEHNEVGFQKTSKMPLFDKTRFSRKVPLEKGSPPKMIKNHEKNHKNEVFNSTLRRNTGPARS